LVISFSHDNEHLFATGGEQSGQINVWDLRMPKYFMNDLIYHKGPVSQIEWCPFRENLLMSSSSDGKVFVWDQNMAGQEQGRHDYEDGPPEMIFPHEAHRNENIEDICWSSEHELMAISVDTNMVMQVWKMSEDFFFNEVDFIYKLDTIKIGELE
jgi:WD40 repeat protein